jgi:hypothetical protein
MEKSDFICTVRRSYKRRSDGLRFEVEVSISVDEIAKELASRAISNRSGEAKAMYGYVKCKVVNSEFPVGTKPGQS